MCCGFSQSGCRRDVRPAAAQLDRHEIVIGLREAGTCEAHQHAALLDPGVEPSRISGDS